MKLTIALTIILLDLKNKRPILFQGARATVNTAAPSFT